MKFSIQPSLSKHDCQRILRNAPDAILSSEKFFNGKLNGDEFEFDYAMKYRETTSSIHATKILPYCSIKGQIKEEDLSIKIEGSVGIVKMRTLIISIIFVIVFIAIEIVLYLNNGPFLKLGVALLMVYFAFFYTEYMRFQSSKKEALKEFEKLFQ